MFIVGRTSKREYSRCFHINRKMLFFGVLSLLLVTASASDCRKSVLLACDTKYNSDNDLKCNATYGAIDKEGVKPEKELQTFAMSNLDESFHILYLSTHFGSYQVNREGFKKLYRKYSDKLWEDAIDIIKYLAKRGVEMNFKQPAHMNVPQVTHDSELGSLAHVLDKMKMLADEAFKIHENGLTSSIKDPAISHYIAEKFFESHTERIRELAGYITELKKLSVTEAYYSVAVFLFDEYLQKSL